LRQPPQSGQARHFVQVDAQWRRPGLAHRIGTGAAANGAKDAKTPGEACDNPQADVAATDDQQARFSKASAWAGALPGSSGVAG
jgi:hypothetical protein